MSAPRAPGTLTNSRNVALQKGTIPAGFAAPDLSGFDTTPYRDEAASLTTSNVKSPATPSPFAIRGT